MSKVSGAYKAEIDALRAQIKNLQETVGVKEIESRDAMIAELELELQELHATYTKSNEALQEFATALSSKTDMAEALKADCGSLQTRVTELEAMSASQNTLNNELSDVITKQKDIIAALQNPHAPVVAPTPAPLPAVSIVTAEPAPTPVVPPVTGQLDQRYMPLAPIGE